MKNKERKNDILRSVKSGHKNYCVGGPTKEGFYLIGFAMGSGVVSRDLEHEGSQMLGEINAFDVSEVSDTYLGQINMINVSSFCGPKGLLWGYDVACEESLPHELLNSQDMEELGPLKVFDGSSLRVATKKLFGTVDNKNFPLYPGGHVFAAKKFLSLEGPTVLYGSFGVAIPEDRSKDACLFMEDVGTIKENTKEEKKKRLKDMIRSTKEIEKNQNVSYESVYVDIITQEVGENERGGVLVAAPYFLLAENAYSFFNLE